MLSVVICDINKHSIIGNTPAFQACFLRSYLSACKRRIQRSLPFNLFLVLNLFNHDIGILFILNGRGGSRTHKK